MKKRIFAVVCAFTMAVSLLGGCGSSNASKDELNIMVWDGTWDEEVFEAFEEE